MKANSRFVIMIWFTVTLAVVSALITLYWTLGGTIGLRTVGGGIEKLAKERSSAGLALGVATVALKLFASGMHYWLSRRAGRLILLLNAGAALLLMLWGGLNVFVGSLVLMGIIGETPVGDNLYALKWHVFFWDAYFLI